MSMQARDSRFTKRSIPVLAVLCVMVAAVPFAGSSIGRAFLASTLGASRPEAQPVAWREVAGRTVIEAADRGNNWIRFDDGVEIEPAANAKPTGRPLGIVRADFDNDGMPDLAVSSADGTTGAIRIFRGNLGAVFPYAPEAREAVAAGTPVGAPFLLPALDVATPVSPEHMIAGDFDGDGNADLAVAKSGDDTVYVLPGIGHAQFGAARSIALAGTVTALAAGDVNRPDGRPEILVGVANGRSAQILVVSGVTAAGAAAPLSIDIPGNARDIAVGDVTGTRFADVIAATTAGVVLVPGLDSARETPVLQVEIASARSDVRSIALGDFGGGYRLDVAILGDNGSIDLLVGPDPLDTMAKASEKPAIVEEFASTSGGAVRIVAANVSSRTGMDLVALDGAGNSLAILEGGRVAQAGDAAPVALNVAGSPVAALAMRLNPDATDDLVVVSSESATPVVMTSSRLRAPFVVTNTNDAGAGSLRDAIAQANTLGGADSISFSIAGAGPHTISLMSALGQISEQVDIDGTTEPDFAGTPIVVLNGSGAGGAIGLDVVSASSVKVRGLVIQNFSGAGISVNSGTGPVIEGCYIGTNLAGTIAAPNLGGGVVLTSTNAGTIGGTTAAARNVISGNGAQGVQLQSFANGALIQGNYIGVTAGGNTALGNALNGVEINDGISNLVGDGTAGATNVISSNTAGGGLSNGVYLHGGMSNMNQVSGNIIGLASNGTTVLGNGANGVLNDCPNTLIGGPTPLARNIISGNLESGIRVESQSFSCFIAGNYIGLDVNGTLDRGNGNEGVWLAGGFNNSLGGPMPGEGNVISGNQFSGAKVSGGNGQVVGANLIGLNASGMGAIPNSLDGVRVSGGAGIHVILNTIAGNTGNGIGVDGGSELEFGENDIAQNGGLGIDLGLDGVTPNDLGDGDMGAGDLQNFPVITSAVTDMGVTTVMGTLNSGATSDYLILFYISPSCDGSGFGEGKVFAGNVTVTTDNAGDAPFSVNLDIPAMSGESVTATASLLGLPKRSGKARDTQLPTSVPITTSEFSQCFTATTLDADVSISLADAPDPVAAGSNITYTLTVNNAGPLTADNTLVSIDTPPNTTFQSASAPIGWSVMSPAVDGTGTVTFSNPMLMPGGPQMLTVVVKVLSFTSGGTVIPATSTISSDLNDPSPSNNSAMTTTTVQQLADLTVNKFANVSSAMPGTDIIYTVEVSGNGPDDSQNVTLTDVIPTNTTFQSIVSPGGWTVMTPPVNGTGTITATRPTVGFKTFHQFTITVRVNNGVSGGVTITNTATVSSSTPDPDNTDNSASVDVTVDAPPAQADLSVTRVASPDPAIRGENLTYTVTVSNNGPDTSSILALTETLPADVTLVSFNVPAGWTVQGQGGGGKKAESPRGSPLVATANSMAPNTAAIFTVVVSVSLLTPDGTFLEGQSQISSEGTPDPNQSNNLASTSTEVGPPPQTDLELDKTATPSTVAPGSSITYNLVATNIGTENATDLTISDATPAGTTFVSASPSSGGSLTVPSANGTGSIACVWPGVTAPGESRTLTVILNVSASAENGSTIVNTASTASLAFESDFSNNSDSASVAVSTDENLPMADVEISTSSIPEMIDTGEQLVYTILVTNNGPDTAENVLLRTSSPLGTRFVSLTTTQGTVTAPPAGGVGVAEVAIGDIESGNTVTVVMTVNVIGEGGDTVSIDVVIESDTNDPVGGNNSISGSTDVVAGNDVLLTWDPPLPTVGDERNPPLHLQSQTVTKSALAAAASKVAGPRNTLVGYNIYRSNTPNTTPIPSNFFTSVGPGTTTVVAPTAPGGSFFVVTAQYPNGESGETNAASGGIPEPDIDSFQIKGRKVIVNGTGFTDNVTVFIDGIPFTKTAKVKKENTRVQQKGRLLTGQSVSDYLNQQGGVLLVSVLNSDTGIGTFLYRR